MMMCYHELTISTRLCFDVESQFIPYDMQFQNISEINEVNN